MPHVDPDTVTLIVLVLDLAGVLLNAMLGAVIARGERFDLVGFATLAILSGLGGGLIRDTLLQAGTPVSLTQWPYVVTALVGALIVFVLPVRGRTWRRSYAVIDALALGLWAAAGAQKTLAVGLSPLSAILIGTIAAVGGGFVRDVVLRRVPSILGGNTLYATCALVASAVMVGFATAGTPTVGLVVATVVGAGLVLLARRRGWMLPTAWELPRSRPGRLPQDPASPLPRPGD